MTTFSGSHFGGMCVTLCIINEERQQFGFRPVWSSPHARLFNQNKHRWRNSIILSTRVAPLFLAEWRHRIQFALSTIWLIGGGICCPHCRGFRVPGFQLRHSAHAKLASDWRHRLFQALGRLLSIFYILGTVTIWVTILHIDTFLSQRGCLCIHRPLYQLATSISGHRITSQGRKENAGKRRRDDGTIEIPLREASSDNQ